MRLTQDQLNKLMRLAIKSGEKHNLPNAALIISKEGEIIETSESSVPPTRMLLHTLNYWLSAVPAKRRNHQ